jgi:hypothetical protein
MGLRGLLRARGASETVLVQEVDEIAALGALGDFCLMRKSRKLHMYIHISIYVYIYEMRENRKVRREGKLAMR